MTGKAIAFLATARPAEARRFFTEALGLPLVEEHDFAMLFDVQGTPLRLQKVQQVFAAPYTVFGFEVPHIEASIDALRQQGVEGKRYSFLDQDERGIWLAPGGAKVFWFQDPDGNLLSLSQTPS
jgi:catechol 2,3-dioxygenase-like lactoylglutathione lyase family enzyme